VSIKLLVMRRGRVVSSIFAASILLGLSASVFAADPAVGPSVPWSAYNTNYGATIWLRQGESGAGGYGWKHIQSQHGLKNSTVLKWIAKYSNQAKSQEPDGGGTVLWFGTTYHPTTGNTNKQVTVFMVVKFVNGSWGITTAYPLSDGQGAVHGIVSHTNITISKRNGESQFPSWINTPSNLHRDGLVVKGPTPSPTSAVY